MPAVRLAARLDHVAAPRHDLHRQPHARPVVVRREAVGVEDVHDPPLLRVAGARLSHLRACGTRRLVARSQKLRLAPGLDRPGPELHRVLHPPRGRAERARIDRRSGRLESALLHAVRRCCGEVERSLGLKISWMVPNDFKTAIEAINFGEPVVIRAPRAEISTSLTGLAQMLNAKATAAAA